MIDKKSIKSNNGITLIALVVTIIIILILASVTLAQITGDDGLLNKTREFSENTNTITNDSNEELNSMSDELDEIINPWVQNKTVVTKKTKNGTITKEVGEDYEYDCGVASYTGGWKVLGAERGKLLIMSTVDVGTLTLEGKDGYNNGISQLNTMCAKYGTNARSIKVEDINRVTGYTPEHQTITITSENKYYYDEDQTNQQSTNGSSKYKYADMASELGTTDNEPITGKAWYYYYPSTLTTSDGEQTGEIGISKTSPAYKLLFRNADDSANCGYWLASSFVRASSSSSNFGLRCVNSDGYVYSCSLWYSYGGAYSGSYGVRAVVPVD